MNEVILVNLEESGDEIVLSGGEGLDNVSSLATDVQVVDLGVLGHSLGARGNTEHVATVLEGTASLGSEEGKGEVSAIH